MRCSKAGFQIGMLRTKAGLTQKELGEKLGVTRNQIDHWERGRPIKADDIIRIADFFHVSCDELLTGTELKNTVLVRELGLSNDTINRLVEYNKSDVTIHWRQKTIDILVSNPGLLLGIAVYFLDDMKDVYFHGENQSVNLHLSPNSTITADDYERITRLRILDELKEVRDKIIRSAGNETGKR